MRTEYKNSETARVKRLLEIVDERDALKKRLALAEGALRRIAEATDFMKDPVSRKLLFQKAEETGWWSPVELAEKTLADLEAGPKEKANE